MPARGTVRKSNRRTEKQIGATWTEWFHELSVQYGDLSPAAIQQAFQRTVKKMGALTLNPDIQNRRVKAVSSLPKDTTKQEIVDMLQHPQDNEMRLRQVSGILEYTAYPMQKIRTTYQDLLTYRHFVYPAYASEEDTKSDEFKREWRMVCKIEDEMQVARNARMIVGQTIRDGKVFYVTRLKADKSHNQVTSAYLQQLPQDWVKIAGFNNISKYTVAFNLFYFLQPGTDWRQFGDLFEPYMEDFYGGFDTVPDKPQKGVLYASKIVNNGKMYRLQEMAERGELAGNPDIYSVNNARWYYWVYLPADRVWTFEVDDTKATVISPMTGLFLSMAQIAQYEQVQLEIVQNPLVALLHGELETYDAVSPTESDPIKVSPTGRAMFENLFYQMLSATNTGGVGIFSAPFKNMKLEQLEESPNANNISSSGYEYAMEKSGMSALIPTNSEARAGVAQISLMIESGFAKHIYWQFERMMNVLFSQQNFKYQWRFHMFGSLAEDAEMLKDMVSAMTLGILPDVFAYNALRGRTVMDDLSMSNAVKGIGVLDNRIPLITSYSAKQDTAGLPPKGGRPANEGAASSDGNEADMDDAKGANGLEV